jgi:hypothetical protein
VIRQIAGEVARVGGTASESGRDADFAQLSVALATAGPLIRWSVAPAHSLAAPRITLVGERGTASLEMRAESGCSVTITGENVTPNSQWPAMDLVAQSWQQIERAITGEEQPPAWVDAARTLDIADCVSESVRRGRWIDAVQEDYSGEGAYKGLMGMLGCGLLLLALASFLAVALFQMVARQAGLRDVAALLGKWPYALLVILCAFLVLQAVRWLRPRGVPRAGSGR